MTEEERERLGRTTTDVVSAETLEKVEAAKKAIIAGEKTIPTSAADCPAFTLNG